MQRIMHLSYKESIQHTQESCANDACLRVCSNVIVHMCACAHVDVYTLCIKRAVCMFVFAHYAANNNKKRVFSTSEICANDACLRVCSYVIVRM